MGCTQAGRVNNDTDPKNGSLILSFANPAKPDPGTSEPWGATLFGNPKNTTKIREGVQQYGKGFHNCLSDANRNDAGVRLYVGLGVTNQFPSAWSGQDKTDHGKNWAQMVVNANEWLVNNSYSGHVFFRGAFDVEIGYSKPTGARNWVDGYNSVSSPPRMYAFGDAAGCQTFSSGDASACGTPENPEWTSGDVHYVAWRAAASWPFPQIYLTSGTHAEQWVMISKWGIDNPGWPAMAFRGPVSQQTACNQVGTCVAAEKNSPDDAWSQLREKMDARPATIVDMEFSTDFKWKNP